jgi:putative membrane protein
MESATPHPDETTSLSIERTALAAENTLMGWIRTTLAMIGFGFTLGQIGKALGEVGEVKGVFRFHTFSVEGISDFLVILGTVSLLLACWQYRHRVRVLRKLGLPSEISLTLGVALLIVVLGAFALTTLVMAL